jgi:hypothetical protein
MAEKVSTLPVEALATLLSTTAEELRYLARRGRIPKIKDGKLPHVATVQAYCRHLRNRVVTTEEAGERMGISGQMVRVLIGEGFIQRVEGGVELEAAMAGYIRWLKDESRRSTKSKSESDLKAARQKEIEMRMAERARELIATEDAIAALDMLAAAVRAEFIGLPAQITRDLALRRKIEDKINGALGRVAEALREAAVAARKGGDALGAAPEADA